MELATILRSGVLLFTLSDWGAVPMINALDFFSIGGIYGGGPPPNPERMIFVQSSIRNNIRSNDTSFTRPFHTAARLQHTTLNSSAEILRKMCLLLSYNVSLTVGEVDLKVANMVATTSQRTQVPFLTTSFPMKECFPNYEADFMLSLRPSLVQPLLDLLQYHQWNTFSYIYEGQRGFRRLSTFTQLFPRYGYNVIFKNLNGERPISDTLKYLRDSGIHHIIFDISLEASQNTVRQLQESELGMVTASYHYIFMDLDIGELDMNQFQLGGLNITGFRLDINRDKYQYFIDDWRSYVKNSSYQEVDINYFHLSNPSLSLDMMDVALEALDMFRTEPIRRVNKRDKALGCNIGSSNTVVPNPDGPFLIDVIKRVKLQGLTGNIEFDNQGDRANYTLQILGLRESGLVQVGTWDGQKDIPLNSDPKKDVAIPTDPKRGRIYTVTSILSPPFLMLKKNADELEGNDRFEGYCMDLIIEITKFYPFRFKFKLVTDTEYGSPMENGKWNGMIGELMYGKADIAVAPLTINVQRERVVGFTKPFMSLGVSIMIKRPEDNKPSVFTFMQPLSSEIWMCVVFACFVVSIVLFQVSRFSSKEWHRVENSQSVPSSPTDFSPPKAGERFVTEDQEETENDFGIFNSLWFTVGALMQQGCELCPRSISGRITGGVWWFFTLIIVSSYTANLAAFLTAQRMVMPISSANDLVEQTAIKYGALKGGATQTFFKTSTVPLYRHMWEYMANSEDLPFSNTTEEGVERVRKSNGMYAFLMESVMADFYSTQPPCDTMRVGNLLDSKSYGIGVNKNLVKVRANLTVAILELGERAILDNLKKKWWGGDGSCNDLVVPDHMGKTSALSLDTLAGVFYILLGGLTVALLLAGGNLAWRSRHDVIAAKSRYTEKRREGQAELRRTLPSNAETGSKGSGSHTPV